MPIDEDVGGVRVRLFHEDCLTGMARLAPGSVGVVVTSRGRLLVRAICMVFDRYLRERKARASYSKVI